MDIESQHRQINQTQDGITEIDRFYQHFQAATEKNEKHKKLYDYIVDEVFKQYYINPSKFIECDWDPGDCFTNIKHTCKFYIHIPDNFEENDIKNLCDEKIDEYMKSEQIKDLDIAFICAYNIFVETFIYAIKTFKEIYDIQKKTKEYYLIEPELYDRYILSINWIAKFYEENLNIK
ncbi:hypothetical protein BDAP_001375 [Binucleata daphniae]